MLYSVQVPNLPPAVTSRRKLPTKRVLCDSSKTWTAVSSTKLESAVATAPTDSGCSSQQCQLSESKSATSTSAVDGAGKRQLPSRLVDTPRKTVLRKKIRQLQSRRWKTMKHLQLLKNEKRAQSTAMQLCTVHCTASRGRVQIIPKPTAV